jgi:hypothetical protein
MNGTTDYLEGWIYCGGATVVLGSASSTYFSGALLAPQTGGSGGSTPAGSTADVQYNSGGALAADTGNFTYSSGLLKVSAISVSTITATTVSASTINATGTAGTVSATYGYFKYISATSGLAGSMATLTDVSETGVASGMLLRYNGTKWESVGASTALSTTTMIPNWPDAISCNVTNPAVGLLTLFTANMPDTGNGLYYYALSVGSTVYEAAYNSNGTFNTYASSGITTSNCNVSISTLYANGQAFNFIGSNLLSATTAANGVQWNNNGQLGADFNFTYNSTTAVVSTSTISATNHYGLSVSSTTGTFGSIGTGAIAMTGNLTGSPLISSSNGGVISATYDYSKYVSTTALTVNGVAITGNASGDRIVSGTGNSVAIVANSNTNIISITNSGVTADYFNSNGVLALPGISATSNLTSITTLYASGKVGIGTTNPSATLEVLGTISATAAQFTSDTTVCNSNIAGRVTYASGSLMLCNGTSWSNVGIGVPAGTIAAFAASSCPSGWTEYTASRGRFLRGIDNGAGVDPAGTRAASNQQADAFQGHTYTATTSIGSSVLWLDHNLGQQAGSSAYGPNAFGNPGATTTISGPSGDGTNGTPRTAIETRPVNVAVTFCQYTGVGGTYSTVSSSLVQGADTQVQYNSNGGFAGSNNFAYTSSTAVVSVTGTVSGTNVYAKNVSATGLTMGGNIAMGGNNITGGGTATFTTLAGSFPRPPRATSPASARSAHSPLGARPISTAPP